MALHPKGKGKQPETVLRQRFINPMAIIKQLLLFLTITQYAFSQELRFKKIEIDTNYSFRGLSVVDDSVAWVSGIKGSIGRSTNGGNKWTFTQVKGFEKWDFRTLYAFNSNEAVIANAGSPAYILRTDDGGSNWNIVYTNNDSMAFFDGVDFWNDREGIIYGDPINGRMLLLSTADGGKSWQELPKQRRPAMSEGEASFAASGTGIRCYGKEKAIIATGGKVSRLFISEDKGKNWNTISTPIIQGENSTGIFSFTFNTDSTGIIVGGDYKKNTLKVNHVFYTTNSGKSWSAPQNVTGGYRECVEFVTENTAIAVGPEGADISYNSGKGWQPIPDQKNFDVIRKARKGRLVVAAGNKKISTLIH